MKPTEFYLTKKGLNFKEGPKYLKEEKLIIKFLKDGRKNISQILGLLNKKLKEKTHWYAIKNHLDNLLKEGFVEKIK